MTHFHSTDTSIQSSAAKKSCPRQYFFIRWVSSLPPRCPNSWALGNWSWLEIPGHSPWNCRFLRCSCTAQSVQPGFGAFPEKFRGRKERHTVTVTLLSFELQSWRDTKHYQALGLLDPQFKTVDLWENLYRKPELFSHNYMVLSCNFSLNPQRTTVKSHQTPVATRQVAL